MSDIKKQNKEINKLLLENIKKAINENGFSIKEVAEQLGIDYSTGWRILHGKRGIKPEHIAEIAFMTNRTPNDFFYAKN